MSDLRDFLNWFEGFAENIEAAPDAKQWARIKTRVTKLQEVAMSVSAASNEGAKTDIAPATKATTVPAPKKEIVYPFIIDADGFARNGRTKQRVLPDQVTDNLFDLRGLEGDMKSIVWADDSTGLNGANCNIVAA